MCIPVVVPDDAPVEDYTQSDDDDDASDGTDGDSGDSNEPCKEDEQTDNMSSPESSSHDEELIASPSATSADDTLTGPLTPGAGKKLNQVKLRRNAKRTTLKTEPPAKKRLAVITESD